MGKRVSASETLMADIMGVSRQALRKWDCPRNADKSYDVGAVVQWKIAHEIARARDAGVREGRSGAGDEDADARWKEVRARIWELTLAERLGKVVRLDDVEQEWARFLGMLNTRLQGIPQRLSKKLEGLQAREIAVEIEQSLQAVVGGIRMRYESGEDEGAAEEPAVAASTKPRRRRKTKEGGE